MPRTRPAALALATAALSVGMLAGSPAAAGVKSACSDPYDPVITPSDFTNSRGKPNPINNTYNPLRPGTTYVFDGTKEGEAQHDVVAVTKSTKSIIGVTTVVVRDTVTVAGFLAEDTFDWFAQDDAGNVWYFGEDTKEYDQQGNVISTAGSWEAGVDGAKPGIVMETAPAIGDTYRQEFALTVAEDMASVASLDETVTVPYGMFDHVLKTKEFSCIEAGLDFKYYAQGVGLIYVAARGGKEDLSLTSVK
jgi:hypothetical protein